MKFIIGEGGMDFLSRMTYRGAIGLFFDDTLGGLFAYLIFGIFCILAAIGLFVVLKAMLFGRTKKPKKTTY